MQKELEEKHPGHSVSLDSESETFSRPKSEYFSSDATDVSDGEKIDS